MGDGLWFVSPVAAAELELELVADGFDLSADTERSVQRVLSRMIAADEAWLGVLLPSTLSVRVTLVQDEARFRARAATTTGTTGHTVGYFVPALGEAVIWRENSDERMRTTLVHESSHYLLHVGGMSRVPLWINEGLAELYASARLDGNAVWLNPDPVKLSYIKSRSLPAASELIGGDTAYWTGLGPTPWSRAEYPYGWALCSLLLSTDAGRKTLSEMLAASAVSPNPASAARDAASSTYPGGLPALDRAWMSFVQSGGATIQLPIRTSGGQASGWGRCPDGSLVRIDSGAKCASWVAGPDGTLRYVEQKPVSD